jgi:hypothetical protein
VATWVLIVFVFSVGADGNRGSPAGVTSVPGYASRDDCKQAGSVVERAQEHLNLKIEIGCFEGPKK